MEDHRGYDEIVPGLFLSNLETVRNSDLISQLRIYGVLTVGVDLKEHIPKPFVFKAHRVYSVADSDHENLGRYFGSSTKLIDRWMKKGNVLVHCKMGKSRSSTVVIAWVMKSQKLSFERAFEFVKSKRPAVCPNGGFREQLKKYEKDLEFNQSYNMQV